MQANLLVRKDDKIKLITVVAETPQLCIAKYQDEYLKDGWIIVKVEKLSPEFYLLKNTMAIVSTVVE